jgi:hypothetical protein
MTTTPENEDPIPLDDRLIDRLVDGALADEERRKLLARFEVEPHAWRRCALAFLEAQSWRDALRPLAAPVHPVRPQRVSPRRPVPVQGRIHLHLPALAALAASLVVAFALGWSARGARPAEAPGQPLANVEAAPAVPASSPPVVSRTPDDLQPAPVAWEPQASSPSPLLTEPAVQAWERRGYQVERNQRLVPMALKNGRRVAVPIDEVRLRYVGHRTY